MNNQNANATYVAASKANGKKNGKHKPPFEQVPNEIAEKMFHHYLDPEVNHSLDHIIRVIYSDTKILKPFFEGKYKTIKFLTAAYLADDSDEDRRNKPTILIQLRTRHHKENNEEKHVGAAGAASGQTTYYDLLTVKNTSSGRIGFCPPPTTGCFI